jgi:glycosyltransferase involved in cell wall biosynthesis
MDKLTLVIPAKNEKDTLPKVLKDLEKYNLNILVVLEDDDVETIDAIQNLKNSKILYQTGKGYGDALITGIKKVQTEFFCIFNADGSFISDELIDMYNLVNKNDIDFVFASRYLVGSSSEDDTIVTWIGNKTFSFLGNIFFSLNISDILYTYVMGDTKKANSLRLKKKDFSLCVELPIKAKRAGFNLIDIKANERARIAGKKKVNAFKDGSLILFEMIRLFFNK